MSTAISEPLISCANIILPVHWIAFCKRAALSQQLTRSCTELLFDRALERARELDEHLAETGKVIGPLHGIPISVKDCVNIKGYTSTIGLAGWTTKLATSNSVIFDILEKQGAVIHVKTNVPQSMMVGETATVESVALFVAESNVSKAGETVNVIWGRCSPPFDRTRVAGGSSGGECSLIAFKGSLLGVGTDIGTFGWHPFHRKGGVAASLIHHALAGSVRIPAAMCGVYSLKPSSGRIPYYGQVGVG